MIGIMIGHSPAIDLRRTLRVFLIATLVVPVMVMVRVSKAQAEQIRNQAPLSRRRGDCGALEELP